MKRISLMAAGCAALVACAGVQAAPDRDAVLDFNSCAKPVYPAEAITALREGTVTLTFLVRKDGMVGESKVMKSSGHPDLDTAARDALKVCKFVPAIKKGKPVQEWTNVQYVWTLK